MANYKIITDSGCDLTADFAKELGLTVVPLSVHFREQVLDDSVDGNMEEFFDALRAGEKATTSAINPDRWGAAMEPLLAEGNDLLVVTFSSGLSTTYQSAVIAADELLEKYPQRCIKVVDSLSASRGQGLLMWYTSQMRDAGMSLQELAAWVEENRFHLCHWFTVDDLMYLKRGGRVSTATALLGTMLQIKPLLHVDNGGHLINVAKARGRKGSILALADKMGELQNPGENDTVFICHGGCMSDAEFLARTVKERYGVKTVRIGYVGAVIGSHSGPGTLSLFFMGKHR